MLNEAENSPIVPMNSSTGIPLRTWTFLKTSSDIWGFGAWAPASAMLASHTMMPAATARLGRLDQNSIVPLRFAGRRGVYTLAAAAIHAGCIRNRLRYHLPSDGSGKGRF